MAKRAKTIERDPWEDDEDEQLDPWDVPDAQSSVPAVISREKDEDAQLRASRANEDEWVIKYPEGERPPSQYDLRAREKRSRFLNVLSKTGSLKKAAAQVGLTPRALRLARDKYPDFKLNWQMALDIFFEFEAEESIRHRAIDGTLRAVYYQGAKVGYERVYDSGLTQFWYKANMRDKYGEQSEIKISGNINHGVAMLPTRAPSMDEWEKQAARTLEDQKNNMIDITPVVVDTKPVNVQPTGQMKVER